MKTTWQALSFLKLVASHSPKFSTDTGWPSNHFPFWDALSFLERSSSPITAKVKLANAFPKASLGQSTYWGKVATSLAISSSVSAFAEKGKSTTAKHSEIKTGMLKDGLNTLGASMLLHLSKT